MHTKSDASGALATVAMVVASLCALVVTGLLIRREFFPPLPPVQDPWSQPFERVEDWVGLSSGGHFRGLKTAKVTLVEFSDFECPFCARFTNEVLLPLHAKYPGDLAVVYRHWPLPNHRFAYPAARAAECASDQEWFWPFHDYVFEKQNSLGLITFNQIGRDIGIPDTLQFDACLMQTALIQAIEAGTAAAKLLKAKGTPTIVVNGYLLPSVPDQARLESIIQGVIDGDTAWTRPPKQ